MNTVLSNWQSILILGLMAACIIYLAINWNPDNNPKDFEDDDFLKPLNDE